MIYELFTKTIEIFKRSADFRRYVCADDAEKESTAREIAESCDLLMNLDRPQATYNTLEEARTHALTLSPYTRGDFLFIDCYIIVAFDDNGEYCDFWLV